MSEYSAVAPPPQQNFNQSSAFAAALQRAKQVRTAINIFINRTTYSADISQVDNFTFHKSK